MKLFIGTPVRDSVVIDYHISMIETVSGFEMSNIPYHIDHVIGCSLIEDGRNTLVHRFMKSDCTHLLFIDSDISWNLDSIRLLLKNSHLGIVGGVYPKKEIKSFPIESKDSIGNLDTSMYSSKEPIIDRNLPIEVDHLPAGFMMISKTVFANFQKHFPDRRYNENGENKFLYFSCELVKEEQKHYGEDTNFCRMAKMIGFKCHTIPAIELSHVGNIHYKVAIK